MYQGRQLFQPARANPRLRGHGHGGGAESGPTVMSAGTPYIRRHPLSNCVRRRNGPGDRRGRLRHGSCVRPASQRIERDGAITMRKGLVAFFAGGLAPAICAQPAISAVWNAASYSVTPTGNLTEPRQMHTATLLANGKVLIAGGYATGYGQFSTWDNAELYDPLSGVFSSAGNRRQV